MQTCGSSLVYTYSLCSLRPLGAVKAFGHIWHWSRAVHRYACTCIAAATFPLWRSCRTFRIGNICRASVLAVCVYSTKLGFSKRSHKLRRCIRYRRGSAQLSLTSFWRFSGKSCTFLRMYLIVFHFMLLENVYLSEKFWHIDTRTSSKLDLFSISFFYVTKSVLNIPRQEVRTFWYIVTRNFDFVFVSFLSSSPSFSESSNESSRLETVPDFI